MNVPPDEFRDALSRFASGVTVVTVANGGRLHGATASSFASVSLDPPLVLVVLDKGSRTRSIAISEKAFSVNVLSEGQAEVARAFARTGPKPFEELQHEPGELGAPLLKEALAGIECTLEEVIEGGDHDLLLGRVMRAETRPGRPLLYFDRAYRGFTPTPT